jgi:hypothetical protein
MQSTLYQNAKVLPETFNAALILLFRTIFLTASARHHKL